MLDSSKKQKLLSLLDSLDEHLDGQDGEAMKSPMEEEGEEESPAHEAAEGEPTPAALVVEVGAPKEGPPKPPGGESGGGDAMAVIQAALKSNDPAVKAAAEAFMRSKGG